MAELISRPLVEIAQELRERRLTYHERFGERL
jgi:predicted HTH domain antitoxin